MSEDRDEKDTSNIEHQEQNHAKPPAMQNQSIPTIMGHMPSVTPVNQGDRSLTSSVGSASQGNQGQRPLVDPLYQRIPSMGHQGQSPSMRAANPRYPATPYQTPRVGPVNQGFSNAGYQGQTPAGSVHLGFPAVQPLVPPVHGGFTTIPPTHGGYANLQPGTGGFAPATPTFGGFSVLSPTYGAFPVLSPVHTGFPPMYGGYPSLSPVNSGFSIMPQIYLGNSAAQQAMEHQGSTTAAAQNPPGAPIMQHAQLHQPVGPYLVPTWAMPQTTGVAQLAPVVGTSAGHVEPEENQPEVPDEVTRAAASELYDNLTLRGWQAPRRPVSSARPVPVLNNLIDMMADEMERIDSERQLAREVGRQQNSQQVQLNLDEQRQRDLRQSQEFEDMFNSLANDPRAPATAPFPQRTLPLPQPRRRTRVSPSHPTQGRSVTPQRGTPSTSGAGTQSQPAESTGAKARSGGRRNAGTSKVCSNRSFLLLSLAYVLTHIQVGRQNWTDRLNELPVSTMSPEAMQAGLDWRNRTANGTRRSNAPVQGSTVATGPGQAPAAEMNGPQLAIPREVADHLLSRGYVNEIRRNTAPPAPSMNNSVETPMNVVNPFDPSAWPLRSFPDLQTTVVS